MRKSGIITVFALFVLFLAACSSKGTGYQYSDLPPGDAAHGEELFSQSVNGALACSNCHTTTGGQGAGPSLQDFATVAGSRVNGQSAEEYTFYSILRPSKHLVTGFSNLMPGNYEEKLSKQDTADLISYVLTLGASETSAAQTTGDQSVDIYMIVFRALHIFGAFVWLGSAFFMLAFVQPAVAGMGMDAPKFMQSFTKNTRFAMAMPLSGLVTVLAGLALYYRISDHFNSDWMSTTPGIVLSIGAVFGITAFLHGMATLGPATRQTGNLMKTIGTQGAPPSPEQLTLIRTLTVKTTTQGRIGVVLMAIAVLCMASARYF
jgi:uncharacterized membrane protein/mono/diheme cytochrome c family protein